MIPAGRSRARYAAGLHESEGDPPTPWTYLSGSYTPASRTLVSPSPVGAENRVTWSDQQFSTGRPSQSPTRASQHDLLATDLGLVYLMFVRVLSCLALLARSNTAKATWKQIRRRYFRGGSWPASQDRVLLNPTTVGTSRYRYRGAAIPTPWPAAA